MTQSISYADAGVSIDNANRAVAPGTYRVEILAETPDGERVRKIVPVNVIR